LFCVNDNIISYNVEIHWVARNYLKEMIENVEFFSSSHAKINYNLPARQLLNKNPVGYDMDPKFVFNTFTLDFSSLIERHANSNVFNFDRTKGMKHKIKARHLVITEFSDLNFGNLRILLTLFFLPLESLTIEITQGSLNSLSLKRVL